MIIKNLKIFKRKLLNDTTRVFVILEYYLLVYLIELFKIDINLKYEFLLLAEVYGGFFLYLCCSNDSK